MQNYLIQQNKTSREIKIQEKAQLNVAEFLAGAGKKSETKTKQKHFPKIRVKKKRSAVETLHGTGDGLLRGSD